VAATLQLFSLSGAAALIVVVILKHATLRICSNARPRTAAFRIPTSVTAWTTAEIRLTNETAVSKFVFSLLFLLALCLTKRIVCFHSYQLVESVCFTRGVSAILLSNIYDNLRKYRIWERGRIRMR